MRHFVQAISIFLVLFALIVNPCAYACTALMLPQSPNQVLAANMDWATPQGLILINKRDVQKTSALIPAPRCR